MSLQHQQRFHDCKSSSAATSCDRLSFPDAVLQEIGRIFGVFYINLPESKSVFDCFGLKCGPESPQRLL